MIHLLLLILSFSSLAVSRPLSRLDNLSDGKVALISDLQPCVSGTICSDVLNVVRPRKVPMKHKPMRHKGKKAGSSIAQNQDSGTDLQTSLTLDSAVIAKGFANNGLNNSSSEKGQVAALTSTNNFINFCKTVDLPITNGQQLRDGSCNPAPMGVIPSTKNMPSSKFVSPKNGEVVKAKQTFKVRMAVKNLETGNFVNPDTNYFAAPQQVNKKGDIIGHSHVVIEKLTSLDQTTPTDPNDFAFFKGLNKRATKDILSVDVTGGLPAGTYRLSSINTAASHQPVLVPIAQRGALDDMIYFTVQ